MSSITDKISEDIEEYEDGCARLGVKARYTQCTNGAFPDCYSNHATWVKQRLESKWLHIPEPPLLQGIQFTY